MARPSKLTQDQRDEIDRRLAMGEGVRALAREFGVGPATIIRNGVPKHIEQIRNAAQKMADAQTAVAELPVAHQYRAMDLASKLRNISESLASAAELGAKTSHRLQALANTAMQKVDDEEPLESMEALKGVAILTKMANESAATPLNLLAANKATVERINDEKPPEDQQPLRPQISRDEWLRLHA